MAGDRKLAVRYGNEHVFQKQSMYLLPKTPHFLPRSSYFEENEEACRRRGNIA
jgi:hypothetical protein